MEAIETNSALGEDSDGGAGFGFPDAQGAVFAASGYPAPIV
jgi:hypothetical protein